MKIQSFLLDIFEMHINERTVGIQSRRQRFPDVEIRGDFLTKVVCMLYWA